MDGESVTARMVDAVKIGKVTVANNWALRGPLAFWGSGGQPERPSGQRHRSGSLSQPLLWVAGRHLANLRIDRHLHQRLAYRAAGPFSGMATVWLCSGERLSRDREGSKSVKVAKDALVSNVWVTSCMTSVSGRKE